MIIARVQVCHVSWNFNYSACSWTPSAATQQNALLLTFWQQTCQPTTAHKYRTAAVLKCWATVNVATA